MLHPKRLNLRHQLQNPERHLGHKLAMAIVPDNRHRRYANAMLHEFRRALRNASKQRVP